MMMLFPTMMLAQPTNMAVSAATDAAAQAAAATQAAPPVQPPITAQDVAQYVDPGQVAAYLPSKPPESDVVIIFDSLFDMLGNATVAVMFAIGLFLLARIIHAFMIHRSVRRAIEAKSGDAAALIDKLNKPYELVNDTVQRNKSDDDRLALVLIAIGVAIAGFGLALGEEEVIRGAFGSALFPIFVGSALMINRRWQKREQAEEQAAARG
jgi:hypothetical protein